MRFGASFLAPSDLSLIAAQVRNLRSVAWMHALGSLWWPFALGWAFAAESMGPLSTTQILLWPGLMFVWGVIATVALLTVLSRQASEADPVKAERWLIAVYGLESIMWMSLPFTMWVHGNPHNNYFVLIILIANALIIFQLSVHRTIYLMILVSSLAALAVKLLIDGAPYMMPYLVTIPLFTAWAAGLGLLFNANIVQAIEIGLNNRALADDLGRARDEALKQKRMADDANAAKSSFLATMSHELRTPLNAIIGFSQIIRLQMLGREASDKYANYAGDIEDSGKHLLGLINQILDLAKIEAGTMALSPSAFDLGILIDDCARTMRIRAEEKGMTLSVERKDQRTMVFADEMAVRQIVLNLLANAVKFTAKGSVTVALNVQGESVEIAVSDTGCGIDAAHLARIFQPFEQVDNSLAREHGGTGLGLPIVAKLAEAHGGACSVESTLGRGSRFAVRLPIVKDALQSAA